MDQLRRLDKSGFLVKVIIVMTTQENSINEVKRWKPALLAELDRQSVGKNLKYEELDCGFEYHEKLANAIYVIAIGEPPKPGETDHRSLIIGAAIEEADVKTNPNRFVPHLVSSEVVEYSEKFGKGRCGYPHHILYAPRANGIPSYKSVVKRAIKRSGSQEQIPKKTQEKTEKSAQVSSGKGYLVSSIRGSDEVMLHIGMVRVKKEVAEQIAKLIDGNYDSEH
jgi:hypothetical protein